MPKLSFDPVSHEAISSAPSDPEAAAALLLQAVGYLRRGEPLPENLARYLADALESAALKPAPQRGAALAIELHLAAGNRRPAGDPLAIGQAFGALIDAGESQNAAKAQIAVNFGISESTALRAWKTYIAARAAHDRASHDD